MSEPKPYVDHKNQKIVFLTEEEAKDQDDLEPIEIEDSKKPRKKARKKKK